MSPLTKEQMLKLISVLENAQNEEMRSFAEPMKEQYKLIYGEDPTPVIDVNHTDVLVTVEQEDAITTQDTSHVINPSNVIEFGSVMTTSSHALVA